MNQSSCSTDKLSDRSRHLPPLQPMVQRTRLIQDPDGLVSPLLLTYSQLYRSGRPMPNKRSPQARLAFYSPLNHQRSNMSDMNSNISLSSDSTLFSPDKHQPFSSRKARHTALVPSNRRPERTKKPSQILLPHLTITQLSKE